MEIETSWAEAKNVLLSDYKVLCSYFAEVIILLHNKLYIRVHNNNYYY